MDWHLRGKEKTYFQPSLVINSATCQFLACSLGLGIVAIPKEFPLIKDSNLVEICIDELKVDIDVFFITKTSVAKNEMIEELYNFLID